MSCISCSSKGFSSLNNTWTPQSSLKRGQWLPYSFECGSKEIPQYRENYCASCSGNVNSVASQMWTQAGNVGPKDKLRSSIVVKGTPGPPANIKEGFYGAGFFHDTKYMGDYLSINRTWSQQKRYSS